LVNGCKAVLPFGLIDRDEIQVGEFLLRFRSAERANFDS
jgi:hypothetical protein